MTSEGVRPTTCRSPRRCGRRVSGTPSRRYQAGIDAVDAVSGPAHSQGVLVSLLGPLQVDGADRLSPRDRVVLSALAVHSGDVLSADRLADALWGEDPPPSWPKVVQGSVARLRRALGRAAVETTSGGYRLTLAEDEVDVRRFEALVEQARTLTLAGEHDRAAARLAQALDLWRGAALPDLDRWPDGRTEAARLDELRLGAQELLLTERAATGRDVVADAAALVAAQPLRETRWGLLALALYRAGRQSDALSALRRARRTLRDELGLDPGRAPGGARAGDPQPRGRPAARRTPAAPDLGVCPYQGLLVYERADADRFFGRDEEIAACVRVLRDAPLLVVAGPSGSGKSSLVRAGVVPRLERSGHRIVVITPGAEPETRSRRRRRRPRPGCRGRRRPARGAVHRRPRRRRSCGASSTGWRRRPGPAGPPSLVVRADQVGGFALLAGDGPAGRARPAPGHGDELRRPARGHRGTGAAGRAPARAGTGRAPRPRGRGRAGRPAAALARAGRDLGTTRGRGAHRRGLPSDRRDPRCGRAVGGADVGVAARRRSAPSCARCCCDWSPSPPTASRRRRGCRCRP